MKIEECVKKKFRCYNEALGVSLSKKRILKKKNNFCLGYFEKIILLILLLFILDVFCILNDLNYLSNYFCFLMAIFFIILIMRIFLYFYRDRKVIITIINEKGIIDTSFYDLEITISWDKIEGVVIKKNSVTILTSTPLLLYYDISLKEKLIKYIKKYNKDILIIE